MIGTNIDKFKIIAHLGSGSFGDVTIRICKKK